MAQVDTTTNPNDPNNPNNPNGTNPNQAPEGEVSQPATTGGAGAVTTTGAGNTAGQVVGTKNPAQPFQNISSYLAANAPQSETLAKQVAGTVSAPINEASQGITSAADKFTQSVNAGYTPENSDLINAVSKNPSYAVAENPENVSNFQKQLNDTYSGPTDFSANPGYSDLQAKIANAKAQATNTQSQAGIQTLLKNVEGPTTQGINNLDSLLLNLNPNNVDTIKKAGEGANNLGTTLDSTTAAQNALATQGNTTAQSISQKAAKALQDALATENTNLGSQQKTVEGLVNKYNESVNRINPTTAKIAAAIQQFLRSNPNIKPGSSSDPFAAWENLQSLAMPTQSTYASPQDYATLTALQKLGLNDLSGAAINPTDANLAQTFKLPTQLQDAVGKAPEVGKALQDILSGFGGQINTAVQPFQNAQNEADQGRSIYNLIVGNASINSSLTPETAPLLTDPKTGTKVPATTKQYVTDEFGNTSYETVANPAWQDLVNQATAAAERANAGDKAKGDLAGGLQWVNGSSKSLQDLIAAVNTDFSSLGDIGVPSLSYGPNAAPAVAQGAPIGIKAAQDFSKAANTGALAGATAAGVGAGATEAAVAPLMADLAAEEGTTLASNPLTAGIQGFGQTLGPAALAAYGGSNIAQNVAENPIKSSLMTLGNMGLSLATLSLPPQILSSLGNKLNDVVNSIGDFFGGLF